MAYQSDAKVQDQYENYPYPKRDPKDEALRLVILPQEYLPRINHHLFRGLQTFGPDFRALVAGGGTGDHAIFLAEQLRERGGKVVYLDLSAASRAIAEARASARGLTNLEFHTGRIEDVTPDRFGTFDYVTCTGVLHHLADPALGLSCLRSVLAPDGGMGLMVYATYGRDGLYQLQSLLRIVSPVGEMTSERRVELAFDVIQRLPATHRFFRGGDPKASLDLLRNDPVELFDALLHSRDRSYIVSELYELLDGQGLTLVDFTPYNDLRPIYSAAYEMPVQDGVLADRLKELSLRDRQAAAEAAHGNIDLHTFYAAPRDGTMIDFSADDTVPFFMLPRQRMARDGEVLTVTDRAGNVFRQSFPVGVWMALELVDGVRSIGEIAIEMDRMLKSNSPGLAALKAGFIPALDLLSRYDWMLGRHKSIPAFTDYDAMYYGPT